MEAAIKQKSLNGIDVNQLFQTINLIKNDPEIAKFKFRAGNRWIDGAHNRATVKGFYGALKEDDAREPVVFEVDEPPVLLGNNLGANPVEYLLGRPVRMSDDQPDRPRGCQGVSNQGRGIQLRGGYRSSGFSRNIRRSSGGVSEYPCSF